MGNTQTQTVIQTSTLKVNAINAKSTKYTFRLKDSSGKAVEAKTVSIAFNGKI